jgi:hypothetical protein
MTWRDASEKCFCNANSVPKVMVFMLDHIAVSGFEMLAMFVT